LDQGKGEIKMKRIFQATMIAVLAFVSLVAGMPASSALAGEPPWPAGLPWPTTVPWPTAHPLQLGVPWSPSIQTTYAPIPGPLPPVMSSSAAPAATPLPPVALSAPNPPALLPPVVAPLNVTISQPSAVSPSNPPAVVGASTSGGGSSRFDAFQAGDTWRTLGPGASAWYRIGTSGMHMDVWLDAAPSSGVGMAIFAPNGSDKPVGVGTPDKADQTRLVWSGGHWSGEGSWYALVTNNNPASVQYRVTSSQQDISNKTCWSYWEYIGSNPVYWTKCSN
jgi:hypothetical protein